MLARIFSRCRLWPLPLWRSNRYIRTHLPEVADFRRIGSAAADSCFLQHRALHFSRIDWPDQGLIFVEAASLILRYDRSIFDHVDLRAGKLWTVKRFRRFFVRCVARSRVGAPRLPLRASLRVSRVCDVVEGSSDSRRSR